MSRHYPRHLPRKNKFKCRVMSRYLPNKIINLNVIGDIFVLRGCAGNVGCRVCLWMRFIIDVLWHYAAPRSTLRARWRAFTRDAIDSSWVAAWPWGAIGMGTGAPVMWNQTLESVSTRNLEMFWHIATFGLSKLIEMLCRVATFAYKLEM